MAKRRASKPGAGERVRINEGVTMPEFPHLVIGGWTGLVVETQGRGDAARVILKWDEDITAAVPSDYRDHCEKHGLFYEMACLPMSDVTPTDSG